MSNQYERLEILNKDTGEVLGNILKKENEELNITTTKRITEEQKKANLRYRIAQARHEAERDAMKSLNMEYGGFVLMYYVKDELLLKSSGLEFQDIARILMIGTHLDYKREDNMLIVKRNQRVIEPMTRVDMMGILGLKERAFKTFLKNAKASGILREEKKKLYLSDKYFIKGEAPRNKGEYTRLYTQPIKNLFNGVKKASEHKSIGIVMSLIPFLNFDWNYLENTNGDYMTLSQMNALLGYEESNTSRLFKQLRALKVEFGGREHHIITQMVLNEASDEREERVYINPMICYRGKSDTIHQEVIKGMLFGIGKAKK